MLLLIALSTMTLYLYFVWLMLQTILKPTPPKMPPPSLDDFKAQREKTVRHCQEMKARYPMRPPYQERQVVRVVLLPKDEDQQSPAQ
jgi:hypothetical protein